MKELYSDDRRRHPRIYLPFPATIKGINSEGIRLQFNTTLDDFSAGGLRFRALENVGISSEINVIVKLSVQEMIKSEVAINGKVVRVVLKPGGIYEVAIKIEKHKFQ